MAKIRLSKEFNFEMAHALWNYDGKCSNLHGHSYKLTVTIIGEPIVDENNVKLGMVLDFGDLKKIIAENITDRYDHAVVVSRRSAHEQLAEVEQMFEKFEITDYQPTCENMVADFAVIISSKLPAKVRLHSLKLYETATSYAEWYADDNC